MSIEIPLILTTLAFTLTGGRFYKMWTKPPKNIGGSGYRSGTSTKSQAHWDYAQPLAGKIFLLLNTIHLLCMWLILYWFSERLTITLFLGAYAGLFIICMLISMTIVEMKLSAFKG